jgi:GNAT superfamily N-acetyltransferase
LSLTSPPTQLRDAIAADAAAIAKLAHQLGYEVTAEQIVSRLGQLPADREKVVVAVQSGEVCAWMQVGVALSIESEPFAEIRGLVVDEKLRASGIGTQMVELAAEWGLTKGVANLRVRSNAVRTVTHLFYQRRGFTVSKEQKVFSLPLGPNQRRIASTN